MQFPNSWQDRNAKISEDPAASSETAIPDDPAISVSGLPVERQAFHFPHRQSSVRKEPGAVKTVGKGVGFESIPLCKRRL
jgi:hypothetical protein